MVLSYAFVPLYVLLPLYVHIIKQFKMLLKEIISLEHSI